MERGKIEKVPIHPVFDADALRQTVTNEHLERAAVELLGDLRQFTSSFFLYPVFCLVQL